MAEIAKNRNEKIEELEKLAKSVLEVKASSIPRRPIVIEFCGSPKSGKSSCISSLDLFLRRNKFRTKVLTERASVCPVKDKYDPSFNIWTACTAIAELSEILSNNAKDFDVIILDRGVFDALCWFNWLKNRNSLDEADFNGLETFLLINKWRKSIDLIYVFTVTPEESLVREYANLLTNKAGSIMRKDVLKSYRDSVLNTVKDYSEKYQKIEQCDTTNISIENVNYKVTKNTLEILRDNLVEKIGYFEREKISDNLPEHFNISTIQDIASNELKYNFRDEVEKNNDLVQPIPILIITDESRENIFVVKKNKKTNSKSPESKKLLIYLGGHTRKEDSFGEADVSFNSIIKKSLAREIKEETGLNYIPPSNEGDLTCIWVRDNDRSKKHLAVIHIWEVDFSTIKFRLDSNEFMVANNTLSGTIMSLSDISRKEKELERWSKIILKEHFNLNLFPSNDMFSS